jgi:hypothetical protein
LCGFKNVTSRGIKNEISRVIKNEISRVIKNEISRAIENEILRCIENEIAHQLKKSRIKNIKLDRVHSSGASLIRLFLCVLKVSVNAGNKRTVVIFRKVRYRNGINFSVVKDFIDK